MEPSDVQEAYQLLAGKYKLPDYVSVNQDFELDKIERGSVCFARVIRKTMMDKVVNSLGFFDMLLNPINAPRLYHPFLKVMTSEDKQTIEKLYSIFGELSLICMGIELTYSEKAEAETIRRIYQDWNEAKSLFQKLLERVHSPGAGASKKERSYFG
ncbi:hypothetical protein HYZ97_04585 [Candidatus Pacearchaeota archaeon]|nr:hypothetical protein [Candidatus Pacearchaeota archaeon]